MLDSQEAKIAAQLNQLRMRYLERLPLELSELSALAARLDGNLSDRPLVADLHHRLHKLAGSGGTFGLADLSRHARQLEQSAKEILSQLDHDGQAIAWREFATGIAAMPATLQLSKQPVAATLAIQVMPTSAQLSKLWLVEDDTMLAAELKIQLEQFGYDVRLFNRIAQAESAVASDQPDFLILDVLHADDQVNSTEALTQHPGLQALDCPLVFISGQDDFSSRVRAARLGAAGFLLKPLDVPRLVHLAERIFHERQAQAYRVMIVDDDITLSEHFRLALLSAGMEVTVLNRPQDIIQELTAFRPDLVLMDMHMPEYSGPELAMMVRQHDAWFSLPIVYLSTETDLDKQINALGHGADDFLTKPISDAQLIAAVRVRVARSRQLADLMSKDSLTGLLKHARIKEELAIELDRARRNGTPLSVAMLDIDHFKSVNDTYGHPVGDRVIQAIAHVLKQRLRKSDSIGRYGGEEFVVVLPECDTQTAQSILEDIRARFAALGFLHDGQKFHCTLSAGIACSTQHAQADASELLHAADEALYSAKHGGRNQVQIAQAPDA